MENKENTILVSVAGIVIVIGIVVLGYFTYAYYIAKSGASSATGTTVQSPDFKPSGTLYFSLVPVDGSRPLSLYSFTIGDTKPKDLLVDGAHNVSPALSPDATSLIFSRRGSGTQYFQIYTAALDGSNLRQVTNSNRTYKREPVMSHDGKKIAYVAQVLNEGRDPLTPSDWRVIVTDLSGKEEYVTRGVDARFSPDDTHLLVLKDDGLYLFDLSKNASSSPAVGKVGVLVVPMVGGPASQTMKLSVSPDNSMLLWSSPLAGKVVLYAITSWNNFALSPLRTLDTHAYWSAFSPDGNYFALEEVDWGIQPSNPHVVAYGVHTEESAEVADLSAYDTVYFWMSGWK